MINRLHRFHGYGSLRHVYSRGTVVRGPQFSVRVLNNYKREHYRAAVVVSRKVSKSAVSRNRLRRKLYESLRLMERDISPSAEIVINVFNEDLADLSAAKLRGQLKSQLKKAGAIPTSTSVR